MSQPARFVPFAGLPTVGTYNPDHDESFPDDVVNDLRAHPGEWRHPGRLVLEARGGECDPFTLGTATYRAVRMARRLGDQIDGDVQLGYRYRGWRRVRFVRLPQVMEWPQAGADERSHRAAGQPAGQMTIHEAVG